jgi:peptidoglycan/xylan/chitin deacetylase (PgdA/CDA1 family)
VASGHEIGSHTVSHPCAAAHHPFARNNALEDYTLEQMSQQLDEATAQIQELLGVRPVTFAYPCGEKFVGKGPESKSYVPLIAQRFLIGRAVGAGAGHDNDPVSCDLAQVGAVPFDNMDYNEMVAKVSQAAQQGHWVIFLGHDMGQKAHQGTDIIALKALCKYMQDPANGVWVDTVENIGKYVIKQRASLGK